MISSRLDKNFIVRNGQGEPRDAQILFGDGPIEDPFEDWEWLREGTEIIDLLVSLGCFPSKGQARKNWKHGEIEPGWNDFCFGKLKHRICIWNPGE